MKGCPLRTAGIGSLPFPSWLEHASMQLEVFGDDEIAEMQDDAVIAALHDQQSAGLDVLTDGEQTRLDFNLSFYGHLHGIEREPRKPRVYGPPAHDQRDRYVIVDELSAPQGLGVVEEYRRLERLANPGDWLKASIPGPFTLSGRLRPNDRYKDRFAVTEALLPLVRRELELLLEAGCEEVAIDEPSMSCYAYREDPVRLVDIFNRTVEPLSKRCRVTTHLCFGNYKARAVGFRRYAPMFPAFLELDVDEVHLEMASREFQEIELVETVAKRFDVAVGIIDVKSAFIETPEIVADRVRRCLEFAPADKLCFSPDCGLSQTARWASKLKLVNLVSGVKIVREELGC